MGEIRASSFLINGVAVIFDFHFSIDVFLMYYGFEYI